MAAAEPTQPYVGELMYQCLVQPFDFQNAYAVVVSGASWNPCGHMLLNTGGRGGWYFHVTERKGQPRFMLEAGYHRYIKEHGKRELRRTHVLIPNPDGHLKLPHLWPPELPQ